MKITKHVEAQILHCQSSLKDLTNMELVGDDENPHLVDALGDPVPPGTPPPVPPKAKQGEDEK